MMVRSGFRISMRGPFGVRLAVSTLAAAALACGDSRTGPSGPSNRELTPVAATSDWPSATPESQGMDAISLRDLVRRIHRREYGSVTSLVIARNAQLVVEEYFGWTSDRPHTMQSVTKSVTSLLADSRSTAAGWRSPIVSSTSFPTTLLSPTSMSASAR